MLTQLIQRIPGYSICLDYLNCKASLTMVYVHGLASVRKGQKSDYLLQYCQKRNINFLRYDLYGHGESSGELKHINLKKCIDDLCFVLDQYDTSYSAIPHRYVIVGYSLGGLIASWASVRSDNVAGLLLIAPAIGWFDRLKQYEVVENDIIIPSKYCNDICLSKDNAFEGTCELADEHLSSVLKVHFEEKPIVCIHGEEDDVVPIPIVEEFFASTFQNSDKHSFYKVSNGDHRLNINFPEVFENASINLIQEL